MIFSDKLIVTDSDEARTLLEPIMFSSDHDRTRDTEDGNRKRALAPPHRADLGRSFFWCAMVAISIELEGRSQDKMQSGEVLWRRGEAKWSKPI